MLHPDLFNQRAAFFAGNFLSPLVHLVMMKGVDENIAAVSANEEESFEVICVQWEKVAMFEGEHFHKGIWGFTI